MNNQIYLNPDSFIVNNFDVKQEYFIMEEKLEYNLNIPSNNEFKFIFYINIVLIIHLK